MTDKPVYLLAGDEEFLKENWLRETRQKFFKDGASDKAVDYGLFFAKELDLPDTLSLARTRPFLNAKRLIIIKNIDGLSAAFQEQLLDYVSAPFPETILILETDLKEKAVSENKFLSRLSKASNTVFFKKLYGPSLTNWISKRATARKKRIDPRAAAMLEQLKGNNLKAIDEELEKVSLYTGHRPSITEEDINRLVGNDITNTVYDIIDAISRNDKKRVMELTLDQKKEGLGIALFGWNLRLLLRVKECLNLGYTNQRIGKQLCIKDFQVEKALRQAGRLDIKWLRRALSEITDFDLKAKTSAIYDPSSGWQMLMARLLL
ncbi:MAG: DNA polymerase III subunit delta [Candidatus Omnitrophica bacterium]|nr:DNA polymerase III subunit delta [Candidatus Omnitrophota bacterium]